MTFSTGWISLALVLLGTGSLCAQTGRAVPGSERDLFHWEVVPGTRRCELFVSGHRIGLYDADERAYYKIEPDGTQVGPVTPPFPIRFHPSQQYSTTPAPTMTPADSDKAKESAETGRRPWYEEIPPWMTYVLGGCITLLITCVGLAMQFRKK